MSFHFDINFTISQVYKDLMFYSTTFRLHWALCTDYKELASALLTQWFIFVQTLRRVFPFIQELLIYLLCYSLVMRYL